jgi:hypothetical protein
MSAKHCAIANNWTAQFLPTTIETWRKMIADWDADTSKPCPYEEVKTTPITGRVMQTYTVITMHL